MKILHTSDLHLGRKLKEFDLYDDQKHILDEILRIIEEEDIDVTLVAGDIYDKYEPSIDAINLFNYFLTKLVENKRTALLISGNHDQASRLAFGSNIFDKLNIHIVTEYNEKLAKYSIGDADFYLLPFVKTYDIKKRMALEGIECNCDNDMISWILSKEDLNKNRKNILMMHQFVSKRADGSDISKSDSESGLYVGTLEAINTAIMDDFDYVALGHIHKKQDVVKNKIIYSGTPMKYSFSEANNKNSVRIYDTTNDEIREVELMPLRNMRVIEGLYKDIVKEAYSEDIIKVNLLDDEKISDAYENLKKIFPLLLDLDYKNIDETKREVASWFVKGGLEDKTESEVIEEFLVMHTGEELNEKEKELIKEVVDKVKEETV